MSRIRTSLTAGAGRSLLLPALAVLALVLAACGAGASATQSPVATTTVDLPKSYRFAPAAITVAAGATVTWTNHDNFTHNVTLPATAPLTMAPGESVSHTFTTPGLYPYVCSLHPKDMKGSVLVTGS
ncbi:MAG TPA: plastocyanin/azurin family copper-binding protein [Chloroflexota bacterium]|jgi:plastocyanin|nr:plastocyanin/azurin family copper-binding protein [Chloroflexota bacterium]